MSKRKVITRDSLNARICQDDLLAAFVSHCPMALHLRAIETANQTRKSRDIARAARRKERVAKRDAKLLNDCAVTRDAVTEMAIAAENAKHACAGLEADYQAACLALARLRHGDVEYFEEGTEDAVKTLVLMDDAAGTVCAVAPVDSLPCSLKCFFRGNDGGCKGGSEMFCASSHRKQEETVEYHPIATLFPPAAPEPDPEKESKRCDRCGALKVNCRGLCPLHNGPRNDAKPEPEEGEEVDASFEIVPDVIIPLAESDTLHDIPDDGGCDKNRCGNHENDTGGHWCRHLTKDDESGFHCKPGRAPMPDKPLPPAHSGKRQAAGDKA